MILSKDGRVMDGMHRVAKTLWQGHTHVASVRFATDPEIVEVVLARMIVWYAWNWPKQAIG